MLENNFKGLKMDAFISFFVSVSGVDFLKGLVVGFVFGAIMACVILYFFTIREYRSFARLQKSYYENTAKERLSHYESTIKERQEYYNKTIKDLQERNKLLSDNVKELLEVVSKKIF